MAESIVQTDAKLTVTHIDDSTRFLIFCLTCPTALMQSAIDPDSNPATRRVMRSAVISHIDDFSGPAHQIEKIDLVKKIGVNPLKGPRRII